MILTTSMNVQTKTVCTVSPKKVTTHKISHAKPAKSFWHLVGRERGGVLTFAGVFGGRGSLKIPGKALLLNVI